MGGWTEWWGGTLDALFAATFSGTYRLVEVARLLSPRTETKDLRLLSFKSLDRIKHAYRSFCEELSTRSCVPLSNVWLSLCIIILLQGYQVNSIKSQCFDMRNFEYSQQAEEPYCYGTLSNLYSLLSYLSATVPCEYHFQLFLSRCRPLPPP